MKKIFSILLSIAMILTLSPCAFAAETQPLTEDEVFRQVANHTATVTHEVRPLASYTEEEISRNPDLQQIFIKLHSANPYSINKDSISGTLYTTTITTEGGQKVTYRSHPKVTFSVTDVGTGGSADIYSTFEVIETVNVDGNLNSGWDNAIRYRNVTGTMGCGVNTAFTDNVTLSGNTSGTLSPNLKGIIDFVISAKDYSTAGLLLSAFDTISYSGDRVSSRDITSEYVRAVGAKIDKEELFSNNHDLTIQSSMSTIDSTKPTNQSATAVARWKFDVYFFVGSAGPKYKDETVPFNMTYVVNAK